MVKKKDYIELWRNPSYRMGGAKLYLFPNDQDRSIYVSSPELKRTFIIVIHHGPAGLNLTIRGTQDMVLHGNLAENWGVFPPKGTPGPEFYEVSLTMYQGTDWAQQFRAWYEGRGEYPGPRTIRRCEAYLLSEKVLRSSLGKMALPNVSSVLTGSGGLW